MSFLGSRTCPPNYLPKWPPGSSSGASGDPPGKPNTAPREAKSAPRHAKAAPRRPGELYVAMEWLGRYTFLVMTFVIVLGGMEMRAEHGKVREVFIFVMTSVILSGVVKRRDEHGMIRGYTFVSWLLSYVQVI